MADWKARMEQHVQWHAQLAANTELVEDWKPCERTVRLCIEALPDRDAAENHPSMVVWDTCHKALEALLPDPAEELVREWNGSSACDEYAHQRDTSLSAFDARIEGEKAFARWLLNHPKFAQRRHEGEEAALRALSAQQRAYEESRTAHGPMGSAISGWLNK